MKAKVILTPRQEEILRFVSTANTDTHRCTYQVIAEHYGFCVEAARQHVFRLCRHGVLIVQSGADRTIRLTNCGYQYLTVTAMNTAGASPAMRQMIGNIAAVDPAHALATAQAWSDSLKGSN